MRTRWLVIPCAFGLGWLMVDPALAREGKQVTARELLKQGFFQDFDEIDIEALLAFSDITLTVATRTELTPDEAPNAVSIVTSDDIKAMGARTLEDVLRTLPGVDVTTDALGRPQIAIRGVGSGGTGGGSENVLLLMNGHRMNEPIEGGATGLNYLVPVGNIQKIEMLRGPGSALYGSGAVAGVIDIVTFSQRDFTGIEASAGVGSFATQQYAVKLGSEGRSLKIAGYIEFENSHGARRVVGEDAQTDIDRTLAAQSVPAASLAPGPSTDDRRLLETNYTATYKNYDFNLRVSNQRTPGFVGLAESLGTVNDLIHRQILIDASHRWDLPDSWTLKARVSYAQNSMKRFLQAFPPGFTEPLPSGLLAQFPSGVFAQEELNSRRYGIEGVAQRSFASHQVQIGVELDRESAFDNELQANLDFRTGQPQPVIRPLEGTVDDRGRGAIGLFVQDGWSATSKLTVTSGVRFDHYGDVGETVSPRLAAVFKLPKESHLKLIYGRAFRAPAIAEEFFDLPGFLGNPALEPETVDSVETVYAYHRRRLSLSGGVFQSWVRNEIVAEGTFVAGESRPLVNAPGTDIRGLEAEVRQGFGVANSAFLSYSAQHAENADTGNAAAGTPTHIGNLGATFSLAGGTRITPSVLFRSSTPRVVGDPRAPVDGYALVNVAVRVPNVYRGIVVSFSAQNLLNKLYYDAAPLGGVPGDYPKPGRRLFLGATYQF
jgi:outer membrane receptor protein involved in Fe transport